MQRSSSRTFINRERQSPEGLEPSELKSVKFGIDIVGEESRTIIHHKVAARVVCVFSDQDAHIAARAEQHQQQYAQHPGAKQASSRPSPILPAGAHPNPTTLPASSHRARIPPVGDP